MPSRDEDGQPMSRQARMQLLPFVMVQVPYRSQVTRRAVRPSKAVNVVLQ